MQVASSTIHIETVPVSRLNTVDMDNIPFGRIFSDHMFRASYRDGQWQTPEIVPYQALSLHPSMSALNYGQSVFEGMKAYRNPQGDPVLFRPKENHKRLNRSGARLCMPEIPEDLFINGLKELIRLDQNWIPDGEQGSLYIRPLYFATDEYIGVKASDSYELVIFTCPVGAYYTEPVNLLVSREFIRAAVGGTGSAKAAGNYAASLLPDKLAKAQGYHNVLWLDAKELRYIEECGTMNIAFVINGKVVLPHLTGTILPGITRNSCLQLLHDNGYEVDERQISIYEIIEAHHNGSLQEAFGMGTAATISHIARIGFNGSDLVLPPISERAVGNWLASQLSGIKQGEIEDQYDWVEKA
ncbi:MAG: branched-chain amino acid aminotransferase [Bacteroidota bacterium]